MRYVSFLHEGKPTLGVREGDRIRVIGNVTLESLLARGVDLASYGRGAGGAVLDPAGLSYLPPLSRPNKIFCIGLNYADHTKESPYEQPSYPTVFPRYHTSLVAHGAPIIRPKLSDSLDFEGEMAVVLKSGGRYIAKQDALNHIAGYAVFNEGSIREYQFKSPQWTIGKNFDGTGGFGPDLVTADEVPPGGKGLRLETRLNGTVVQSASTDDMLFDVATLISVLSEAITLEAGDLIVTGTPAGIGWARTPKLMMKHGDVCEVTIEKIGTLRNPIVDEDAR
jgi:acylpyruvate hydrolase